ncbi:MAG TPA: lipid A deacylase LpxR family protein [Candidatus Didemnitutus sp.]|nr:lipid A deacylase LpxR family protein [Candidatus Didemnitutus sp.]
MTPIRPALTIVAVLLAALPQLSAEPEKVDPLAQFTRDGKWSDIFDSGAVTTYVENDKFFAGTDRHYTNGAKLSFLGDTRLNDSPPFVQTVASVIPWLASSAKDLDYKVGAAIGQNIYTPTDIHDPTPDPDDRPYAAWLYGALMFQAENRTDDLLRIVEIQFGIVGPSALGRQVQNGWHDVIGAKHAEGWSHQLHNEPGLVLTWERRFRLARFRLSESGFSGEALASGGLSAGNVDTSARAGTTLRFGWEVPSDFGPDLIRAGGGDFVAVTRSSCYLYGAALGRAVARDIFLDGNTWQSSPSVDKRPLVADFNVGLVVRLPWTLGGLKGLQVTYAQDYRTKEFYGQKQRDVFGSITLSSLF